MKVFSGKLIMGAALSAVLAGCGGGDDGDSDNSASKMPNIPLVDGSLVYASESGKYFQDHITDQSIASGYCDASPAYFESNNVMAYSAANHSQETLQKVASVVEYSIDNLIGKFGYSNMETFMGDRKRVISPSVVDSIAYNLTTLRDAGNNPITVDQLSSYFASNIPSGYSDWGDPALSEDQISAFVRSALISMPNGAQAALVADEMLVNAKLLTGQEFPAIEDAFLDGIIHEKIQVCVLPEDMKGSAEGNILGFNIAVNEEYGFYVHEGTHFIQKQYAQRFPRWMTEGQAVFFSGQKIATSKSGVNVMEILSHSDEDIYGQDFYGHYGLAYKALHLNNSIDEIMGFLQSYDLHETWIVNYALPESDAYQIAKKAFEDNLVDWGGQSITYENFANIYDSLAK